MLAERIKVSPRRISVAGQEEVWSVGVVAPVSEETGWGFGPTCNIAYMHALKNLEKALVQTDQLKTLNSGPSLCKHYYMWHEKRNDLRSHTR